jgi:hypothetical protein
MTQAPCGPSASGSVANAIDRLPRETGRQRGVDRARVASKALIPCRYDIEYGNPAHWVTRLEPAPLEALFAFIQLRTPPTIRCATPTANLPAPENRLSISSR